MRLLKAMAAIAWRSLARLWGSMRHGKVPPSAPVRPRVPPWTVCYVVRDWHGKVLSSITLSSAGRPATGPRAHLGKPVQWHIVPCIVVTCSTKRAPKSSWRLGNVALRALTSYGSGKTTISHVQGYLLDGPYDGTHVIGTFHPSALMQGLQGLSGVAIWAIQRAIDIARHGFAREPVDVIAYPSLEDMQAFERGWAPDAQRLDFDIETPESTRARRGGPGGGGRRGGATTRRELHHHTSKPWLWWARGELPLAVAVQGGGGEDAGAGRCVQACGMRTSTCRA